MKKVVISEEQLNRVIFGESRVDEGWLKNAAIGGLMGAATMFGGSNANAQNMNNAQTDSGYHTIGSAAFENATDEEILLLNHYVDMGFKNGGKVKPTEKGLQFYEKVMRTRDIKNKVSDENYQLLTKWISKNFNKLSQNNVVSAPTNNKGIVNDEGIAQLLTKLVRAEIKIAGMYYIMNYKDTETMNDFVIILPFKFVSKIIPK